MAGKAGTASLVGASYDPIAVEGENCWRIAHADKATLVVDAEDYFRLAAQMMGMARRRIIMIGWDFDTRIRLIQDGEKDRTPTLGEFILQLARDTPQLDVRILRWDFGAFRSLKRGSMLFDMVRWRMQPNITMRYDGAHPSGCSHHQKILIIDDDLAVCGGIDMTGDRWDTRQHLPNDPRRTRPGGDPYDPWHDATMIVTGQVANSLAELAASRWERATGQQLASVAAPGVLWPDGLTPDFQNIRFAMARTIAPWRGRPAVQEIQALHLATIARATRTLYLENQYFTSPRIAAALVERMREQPELEVVLVTPLSADGWLEKKAMDGARVRLVNAIHAQVGSDRLRVYYPVNAGGTPIYVHAKITVVDDRVLRIGSANLNNRSMALDSECDLMLELDRPEVVECAMLLRDTLVAEHLDATIECLRDEMARQAGSLIRTIEALRGEGRSLVPLPLDPPTGVDAVIADNQLLDPERADQMFEPFSRRHHLIRRFRAVRGSVRRRFQRGRQLSGRKSGTDR